ncbi:MAG: hypothetical protein ACFFAF_12165 [Candidatus Hermodarchaeota archaeon]
MELEKIIETEINFSGKVEVRDRWIRLMSDDYRDNYSEEIRGKYLFFSNIKERLVLIAIDEIQNNGFKASKISVNPDEDGSYVLCLYYTDDSRKHELANKYISSKDVRYRYWKYDYHTRQKVYSVVYAEKEWSKHIWIKIKCPFCKNSFAILPFSNNDYSFAVNCPKCQKKVNNKNAKSLIMNNCSLKTLNETN